MRCPFCAAPNRDGAGFCLECGEPLDAVTLAARGTAGADLRAGPRGRWPRLSLGARDVLLGLALVCLVLGVDRWNTEQQAARDRQAVAYRQGVAAVGARHWADAVTAFGAAGDYKDAARRRADAAAVVTRLTQRWDEATAAAQAGAWWAATLDYAAIAATQPDYPEITARWSAARAAAGPLLYRVPAAPGEPALWWAAADGTDSRPIPGSDANSQIHGIAPDGHWAIFSLYMVESATLYRRVPYLLDLRTGATIPLVLPPDSRAGVMSAQFRDDSSGFWWQVEDRIFYAALPVDGAAPVTGVTLLPCAPGIVARDPARGLTVLLVHDQHTPTPGVPAWLDPPDSTVVLLGDAWGRNARILAREAGTLEEVALSPGGRYLIYRVTQVTAGSQALVDTLVLFDTSVLAYYPGDDKAIGRHVIETAAVAKREWLVHDLQGWFLPGADAVHPRLLIKQAAVPLEIYDAATGTRRAVATTAADHTWQLAASPPAVSPGGRWLALEVWSFAGDTILSRMVVQPTTGGTPWSMLVPADLPTWVGFSGDERYAFYALSRFSTRGEQQSRLLSVPVPDGAGGPDASAITPLIDHRLPSPSWLRNVALTPDGRHLLALISPLQTPAVPDAATHGPGLYALRPDGADWLLLAPAAIEFWVAGSQPWAVPGVP
jgi:hypothetical protein